MTLTPEYLRYSPGANANYHFYDDANTNIACITDDKGTVVERYIYNTFSLPTIKDSYIAITLIA